ncbi:MAG: iron chelate uptake ABC transporter family permease subunit [Methanomassiliicoccales archaeon]|nr:iron chelate uptake ABC transporter family permease subunit [Methanomassiliicoccales archaeon]
MEAADIGALHTKKLSLWFLITVILVLLLLGTVILALCIGPVGISVGEIVNILFGGEASWSHRTIILEIRLPRVLLGGLVGASLAIAGAGMQGLFRNPMASPYVLGISSGAAFGASLSIVLGFSIVSGLFAVPVMAFIFSFITLVLVYNIAKVNGRVPVDTLLLAGIAIAAFFTALVSFMKYLAGEQLSSIVFWMMGGLWDARWEFFVFVLPMVAIGVVLILVFSRDLNVLMIGEEHAVNLGINVPLARNVILVASSLVTAAAVSVSGVIAFVGLIVPHMMRLFVGPDNRILLPASCLVGAIFMIWTDTLARTIIAPEELPVGIITAILGAPFFLYLLKRRKGVTGW